MPATPADPTADASPSTAQPGSGADLLDPALTAKLATSLAGATGEQPRSERTASGLVGVASGIANDGAQQQRRRQLFTAGSGDEVSDATPADTGAEQQAESTPREQKYASSRGSVRKLDLSAYRRGPAARVGAAQGTDPSVCLLRCEQTSADSELKKVR